MKIERVAFFNRSALSKTAGLIRRVAANTCNLFAFARRMDKTVTLLYNLTAALSALSPLAASYVLKLLIDYLQRATFADAYRA